MAGVLTVDNSILASVAKCDTYAYVRYGCHLATKGDSLALAAGSAIHLGLARWLQGEGDAVQVCADAYDESVERYLRKIQADNLPAADKRFEPEWVTGVLAQYLERFEGRWPFKPLAAATERPIHAPFDAGELPSGRRVDYVARLDGMVRRWESGGKWSLDWKTTKRASDWWIDKMKVSSQFTGQDWIQRQRGQELEGVVVAAIEIPEPHKSEAKCKDHKVSYQECSIKHAGSTFVYITRSDAEREAWRWTARQLIRRYDRLLDRAERDGMDAIPDIQMQGRFNESCTFCSQREWCRLGRPTKEANLRATFVEDRWDPMREE